MAQNAHITSLHQLSHRLYSVCYENIPSTCSKVVVFNLRYAYLSGYMKTSYISHNETIEPHEP
jgi:hypothetical protein